MLVLLPLSKRARNHVLMLQNIRMNTTQCTTISTAGFFFQFEYHFSIAMWPYPRAKVL